ncbi:MAG: diguanylate cyclase [Burkholderiales bacterium]
MTIHEQRPRLPVRFARSFRAQLLVLALVAILPFATFSFLSVRDLSEHYRLEALNKGAELAQLTSARLSHFVAGTEQLAKTIGAMVAWDETSTDANNAKLKSLNTALAKEISELNVRRPDGVLLGSSRELVSGNRSPLLATQKYFSDAVTSRRIAFSEPLVSTTTGKMTIAAAKPILDSNGSVRYVIDMSFLVEHFRNILANDHLPNGAEVTLLDERGTAISRSSQTNRWIVKNVADMPRILQMLSNRQASVEALSSDGVPSFISYAKTQEAPWIVCVAIPTHTALQPVHASLQRLWWIAAMTALLAIGLAAFISRRIAKPIESLGADVRRLATGDLAHRTAVRARGEVGRLASDFNLMASNLQRNTKELLESESRYNLVLDATTDGVWEIDLEKNLIRGSPKVKGLLGYANEDLPDERRAFEALLHPDDNPRAIHALDNHIKYGVPLADEFRLRAKDGTYRWISRYGQAIRGANGRVRSIVGSVSDITARKHAELEVQDLNAELEQRVLQRTMDLTREIVEHRATQKRLEVTNLELKQSLDRLQQQAREMALLHEMSELLQAATSLEEYNKIISHSMQQLFNAKAGGLFVLRSSRDLVEASVTWGGVETSATVFPPDDCWALKLAKLHVVADRDSDVRCAHVKNTSVAGYVCMPLNSHGETLGIVHLRAMSDGASKALQAKLPLIHTVTEYLGLALGNFRLQQTLRYQSVRDALTELFNRRYMEESIAREFSRVLRDGRELGIVMFDLDHFKRLNDTYGHAMGDAVLRQLGQVLLDHVRGEDIACRYGGEEFIVILPGANLAVSQVRAEELRSLVAGMTVQWDGQTVGNISVSLGVASFPHHGKSWQEVIKQADKALYVAKQSGRNQVMVAAIPW